ncbi:MAG: hypothetical protein ACJAVF_004586 [Paraglaciecola sp.]|jgi:hypothetical protein
MIYSGFWILGLEINNLRTKKTQIQIVAYTDLIGLIFQKQLKLDLNFYKKLQILSVSSFFKTSVNQLFMKVNLQFGNRPVYN